MSTVTRIPGAQSPRVSIIIPASSTQAMLLGCLQSIARYSPVNIAYEVIVVLNEADENTAARLCEIVAGAHIVASPVNLGLAGSGNRGRHLARGELLVLLHDDAEIEPGWLEALVDTADAHPEAGAIGGKVLFPDGRLQNAGMILWSDAYTSPPWIGEPPSETAFDSLRAVDYCGTSALLVRTWAWDAIGGLDERFYPVYYVDVDLAMTLNALGLIVLYQPAARIRHHIGGNRELAFRQFVAERNRKEFLEKWGSALEAYEPPGRDSPQAVDRAIARAEAFAAKCKNDPVAARPPHRRRGFDSIAQDRSCSERSSALRAAYDALQK